MDNLFLPRKYTGDLLTATEFNQVAAKISELVAAINNMSQDVREYIKITNMADYQANPKDTRTLYLCIDRGVVSGLFIGQYSLADLQSGGVGGSSALPIEQQVSDSQEMVPSSFAVLQELAKKLSVNSMESGNSTELAYDQPDNTYSVQRINSILSEYMRVGTVNVISNDDIDRLFNA